jgi:hypothetical protein
MLYLYQMACGTLHVIAGIWSRHHRGSYEGNSVRLEVVSIIRL